MNKHYINKSKNVHYILLYIFVLFSFRKLQAKITYKHLFTGNDRTKMYLDRSYFKTNGECSGNTIDDYN